MMHPIQDETVSQGMLLGLSERGDRTPPIDGTTVDLDVDIMEETDRKKRGTSELVNKINGNLHNKQFFAILQRCV